MIKLIADENLPDLAIALLRDAGYDVLSISETAPRSPDLEVLALAVREDRFVLTFDKSDFGELIYNRGLPSPPGLIMFRISDIPADRHPYFIRDVVVSRSDWHGYFWVITESRVRRHELPWV